MGDRKVKRRCICWNCHPLLVFLPFFSLSGEKGRGGSPLEVSSYYISSEDVIVEALQVCFWLPVNLVNEFCTSVGAIGLKSVCPITIDNHSIVVLFCFVLSVISILSIVWWSHSIIHHSWNISTGYLQQHTPEIFKAPILNCQYFSVFFTYLKYFSHIWQ